MTDPYATLGLKSGATDEEIKKAYKALAKKYHPDVTGNDPEAAKKMQEINAAFDELINHKNESKSYNGYGSYSSSSQDNSQEDSIELQAAANYINARRYREAMNVLSSIPQSERNGKWYYYSAICKARTGDTNGAYSDISIAIQKEPNNPYYASFLDSLRSGRASYTERQNSYSSSSNGSFFSCCLPLVLLNLCCPGYFCMC